MRRVKVLLTGGGTGGHIYPLIAVGQKLKNLGRQHGIEVELNFLGAAGNYREMLEGYEIKTGSIVGSKWRRYFSWANFLEPGKFFIGLIEAWVKVYFIMPDVIFSKSGPGSLPVVLAGVFYRIPIVIHESDAVVGRNNKIASIFAKRIAVGFRSAGVYFQAKKRGKVTLTGNPVRDEIINNRDSQELAKRYWGFDPKKPLILVVGGSQGAEAINDFIIKNSLELLKKYQILHQTGVNNFSEARGELEFISKDLSGEEKKGYKLVAYFKKDIKEAYEASDLVVARAGAGSIFEIAAFAKPAILIPLAGHQSNNADEVAGEGGAVVIEQNNLLNSVFLVQLEKIMEDGERRKEMGEQVNKFFIPHSAEMIAEEILAVGLGR